MNGLRKVIWVIFRVGYRYLGTKIRFEKDGYSTVLLRTGAKRQWFLFDNRFVYTINASCNLLAPLRTASLMMHRVQIPAERVADSRKIPCCLE